MANKVSIDYEQVLADSIRVAKEELGKAWKSFKPYAEHEFQQFAENAEFLAKLRLKKGIDDEELAMRMEIQKLALRNVLLTIKGISLLTAQKTVNAVIDIVSSAILKAIGIALPT